MSGPENVETIDQAMEPAESVLDIGAHTWGSAGAGQEVTVARNSIASTASPSCPASAATSRRSTVPPAF